MAAARAPMLAARSAAPTTDARGAAEAQCMPVAWQGKLRAYLPSDGSGLSDPFYTWGALNAYAAVVEAEDRPAATNQPISQSVNQSMEAEDRPARLFR